MAWSDRVIEVREVPKRLYELLVPTEKRVKTPRPKPGPGDFGDGYPGELARWQKRNSYTTRYHRAWDEKVRVITGGLTVLQPAKGQWTSEYGSVFRERMIPVRIMATPEQMEKIVDMTLDYYDQLAVLYYEVSNNVKIRRRCDSGCQYGKDVGMPEHRCHNGCMLEKSE